MTAIDRAKVESYLSSQIAHMETALAAAPDVTRLAGAKLAFERMQQALERGTFNMSPLQQTPMDEIHIPVELRVRHNSRSTSWEAAIALTPEGTTRMYKAIYRLLTSVGPMTDHELRAEMERRGFHHSYSGLSARRVELERTGWVHDTGEKRVTPNGGKATVWEAVPERSEI